MKTKTAETEQPPTPELNRMKALLQDSYRTARILAQEECTVEQLLVQHLKVDLNKVKRERKAWLQWFCGQN